MQYTCDREQKVEKLSLHFNQEKIKKNEGIFFMSAFTKLNDNVIQWK